MSTTSRKYIWRNTEYIPSFCTYHSWIEEWITLLFSKAANSSYRKIKGNVTNLHELTDIFSNSRASSQFGCYQTSQINLALGFHEWLNAKKKKKSRCSKCSLCNKCSCVPEKKLYQFCCTVYAFLTCYPSFQHVYKIYGILFYQSFMMLCNKQNHQLTMSSLIIHTNLLLSIKICHDRWFIPEVLKVFK